MATADFIGVDEDTQGSWIGVYGSDGYYTVPVDDPPVYVAGLTNVGSLVYDYGIASLDEKYMQNPADPEGNRFAQVWYSNTTFYLEFSVPSKKRIAVYMCDFDSIGRTAQIDMLEQGSLTVLDTQLTGGYADGKWFVWDVNGAIRILFTNMGVNVTVSALMFDPSGNRRRRVMIAGGR